MDEKIKEATRKLDEVNFELFMAGFITPEENKKIADTIWKMRNRLLKADKKFDAQKKELTMPSKHYTRLAEG